MRRKFKRTIGHRRYKNIFIVISEGTKTEIEYFNLVNHFAHPKSIHVKSIPSENSSPGYVLNSIKAVLKDTSLRKGDEAWIVVDKDNWKTEALEKLFQWSMKNQQYGFALSNPKFEYWLLLHFEDAKKITSSNCKSKLKKYLSNYDKGITQYRASFTKKNIKQAIARAKLKDTPKCKEWPQYNGTTVYRLVEKILK